MKHQFMLFLDALFIKVGEKLGSIPSGKDLQISWYNYLSAEKSSVDVGVNRMKLYDEVIMLAKLVKSNNLDLPSADLRF